MSNKIKVSTFYIAAYLIAKGYSLQGIEPESNNSNKFLFIFDFATSIEEVIQKFNFASEESVEVMVDARKMIFAIKKLKEVLYQNRL